VSNQKERNRTWSK